MAELTPEEMQGHILEQQQQRLAPASAASSSSGPSNADRVGSTAAGVERKEVVYVQQDRKVPTFSGRLDRPDSLTVEEWIDEMDNFVNTKPISEKEKAHLVYSNLEGAARTEVKFLPSETK